MLDVLTVQFDSLSKPVDPKNKSANLEYLKLLSAKIFRKIRKSKVIKSKVVKSKAVSFLKSSACELLCLLIFAKNCVF